MTMPPILPAWIPWWAQLALLVLGVLFAVALLMMPFAVFGLKGRLDMLEAQLDDIHAELRMLAMRLPDAEPQRMTRRPSSGMDDDRDDASGPRRPRGSDRAGNGQDGTGHDRSEPRLSWPSEPRGR